MNLRQAVAFAVLMGADMFGYAPDYVLEKVQECGMFAVPEVLLDHRNLAKFKEWAQYWDMTWDMECDLKRPMSEVLEEG